MNKRDERLAAALHTAAAEFINRESNRRSLITVMRVELPDDHHARIFVSVYPEKGARAAMDFLSRQHDAFMSYVKKSVKLHALPHVSFLLDPEMGSVSEKP